MVSNESADSGQTFKRRACIPSSDAVEAISKSSCCESEPCQKDVKANCETRRYTGDCLVLESCSCWVRI